MNPSICTVAAGSLACLAYGATSRAEGLRLVEQRPQPTIETASRLMAAADAILATLGEDVPGASDLAAREIPVEHLLRKSVFGEHFGASMSRALHRYQGSAPYLVWLDNRTQDVLSVRVYWVEQDDPDVHRRTHALYPGTMYISLGGHFGCSMVDAYIVQIYLGDDLVAETPLVQPSGVPDGEPCSDAFAIEYD